MKLLSNHIFYTVIAIVLLVSACREKSVFPPEPYLEYKSFLENGNPVMVFSFTDGDGNVGLNQRDTFPPFNAVVDPVNNYHWNLWMKYFEKIDGEWVEIALDPNTAYFRIPRLDPEGQNKALEGDIQVDMTGWYPLTLADTVRYSFVLLDRDLNQSNEAFSEELYP
jgi:hypothetical protein